MIAGAHESSCSQADQSIPCRAYQATSSEFFFRDLLESNVLLCDLRSLYSGLVISKSTWDDAEHTTAILMRVDFIPSLFV